MASRPVTQLRKFFEGHRMYTPTPADLENIERSFTYHAPKGDQPDRYVNLRNQARDLAINICRMVPPGRERALAITNLEQCVMWANKGISHEV